MKAKTTLTIQTIGMYVMQLPLLVFLITSLMPMDPEFQETMGLVLLKAFLVLAAVMVLICILHAVVSVKSAIKGEEDPTKATMIAKLSLIPWYIVNLVLCIVFTSILLNPFMMVGIPIAIALFVWVTYMLMLSTSLPDIAFFVRKKIRKDASVDKATVVSVVLLFVFCLDVIGAILLFRRSEKPAVPENDPV